MKPNSRTYISFNALIDKLPALTNRIRQLETSSWILIAFFITLFILVVLIVSGILPISDLLRASTGRYINVYGCGTTFGDPNSCHTSRNGPPHPCNPGSFSCTTGAGQYAYRWVCDGEEPDCRDTQESYNAQGTFSVNNIGQCGVSVQVDIFSKQCRPPGEPYGNWSCGADDIVDYMTYYIEPANCTPITPTPELTPTPFPTIPIVQCVIDNTQAQFRVGCTSGDINQAGCGTLIDGSEWNNGSALTDYIAGNQYFETLDVRCVQDSSTLPVTLFDSGVVDLYYNNGAGDDVQVERFPMNPTNIDWNAIYDEHGDGFYRFVCTLGT